MFRDATRRNPHERIDQQKVVDQPIDVMRNQVGRMSHANDARTAHTLRNPNLKPSEIATPRKGIRDKYPTANRDAKNARMHQIPVPVVNLPDSKNCKVKFNRLPEMRQVRPRISSGKDAQQNPVANVGKQPVKPKVTANDISQARAEKDIEDRNRDFESLFPDVSKLPDPRLADPPTPQNEVEESKDVTEDESRIPVAAWHYLNSNYVYVFILLKRAILKRPRAHFRSIGVFSNCVQTISATENGTFDKGRFSYELDGGRYYCALYEPQDDADSLAQANEAVALDMINNAGVDLFVLSLSQIDEMR